MARRSSAFTNDLAELDNLQALPLPATTPEAAQAPDVPLRSAPSALSSVPATSIDAQDLGQPTGPAPASKSIQSGTRATQVRLPPQLAAWLGEEAHWTKKTLSTVVALAAQEHRHALQVRREDPDGLDVSRRVASGTVPVTLRLTGAQRQLLDEIASEHAVTRSAVVLAALTAVATTSQSSRHSQRGQPTATPSNLCL